MSIRLGSLKADKTRRRKAIRPWIAVRRGKRLPEYQVKDAWRANMKKDKKHCQKGSSKFLYC
jgi:hypothetical protein